MILIPRLQTGIFIPIYDVEEYLRECLDSIVNQTLENIEIICVNDGSPDDSLSIAEEYQKKDPRITVISQANGGLSVARNIGMQFAHGKYIYFIDSDDYLDITALEKLTELAERERLDVLRFGIKAFYSSDQLKNTHSINHRASGNNVTTEILAGVEYLKDCRDKSIYVTSACLFLLRHDLLTENNIIFKEGIIHEDNLFSFQIFMTAKRVMEVPNTFYHRRVREGSIMTRAKSANNVIGYFSCAMGVLEYALNNDDDPLKEQEIKREYNSMLYAARRDYEALSPQERKKVVFASEMENELFKQLVVNGGTLIKTRNELNETRGALDSINKSVSFRVGRAITWVPRKVRGGVRCYQEHGPAYTFDRTLYHMHLQWLPQKVSGGVQCYRDHGAGYTVRRTLYHIGLWEDEENPDYKNRPLLTRFADCYSEHSVPYTARRVLVKMHLAKDGKEPALIQRMETKTPVKKKHAKAAGQVKKDYAYYSMLPPEKYPEELKLWYKGVMKEDLDLDNPKTFNEKIQWIKLYDSTPLKTCLADKYLVRDWIKEKIGEEYLIPLLGVWDSFDEIDFDKLPDQFVLKANHGSGWNIIVKDKALFDRENAKKKFDRWIGLNYSFLSSFELQYMNIPPKIIAEKYLESLTSEYQYWCFNGEPRFISCIREPHGKNEKESYTLDFERLSFVTSNPAATEHFTKPAFLESMNDFARALCQGFSFVRVDFLSDNKRFYFGEMTFTPANGTVSWEPKEFDAIIGDWLHLPSKKREEFYERKRT